MAHNVTHSPQEPLLPLALDLGDFEATIPLEHLTKNTDVAHIPQERSFNSDNATIATERESPESEPISTPARSNFSRQPSVASSSKSSDIQPQPVQFFTHVLAKLLSVKAKVQLWLRQSRFYGWRMGVVFGCCMSAFVLCCNVAMIVVGATIQSGYDTNGMADLIVGDEALVSRWNTGLHVAINALSTMLLAGSNYTMQVLSSPTRQDVDAAHVKGQWLDIGLLSARNLRAIPRRRAVLWFTLALSSIPLHLFYNASVFKVVTSNGFNIFTIDVASNDWNRINATTDTGKYTGGDYWNMTNGHWNDVYSSQYVSVNGDLYLVVDRVAFDTSQALTNLSITDYLTLNITGSQTTLRNLTIESSEWIRYPVSLHTSNTPFSRDVSAHVVHAFSQKRHGPLSRVQVSLYFMLVVLSFNLLKLIIMTSVLVTDRSAYLVTLGDAVASFLKRADQATIGKCTLGREEILIAMGYPPSHPISSIEEKENLTLRVKGMWLPLTRNYFFPVLRGGKVIFTLWIVTIVVLFGTSSLYLPNPMVTSSNSWAWGGSSDDYLALGSSGFTATATLWNAWLANVPQLLLSFCYLTLNTICTSMAGAEEWNNLANFKKGLRVTQPYGHQRSTYFLQLPYRWSLPLIVLSGTLHWLLSQAFFLVRIDFFNREGVMVESESKSACGFSVLSSFVLLFASLALLGAIGFVGLRGMSMKSPIVASCSLAISAACHAPSDEIDPHLAKVRWGVVEQEVVQGFGHCSLSSKSVKRPQAGVTYY